MPKELAGSEVVEEVAVLLADDRHAVLAAAAGRPRRHALPLVAGEAFAREDAVALMTDRNVLRCRSGSSL